MCVNSTLHDLPDDILIYTISFLLVPDILLLCQTCKWFNVFMRLQIVWTNAFKLNIASNNYPFPIDDTDLEHRTCDSYRLMSCWLTDSSDPEKRDDFYRITSVFKGIWSVLTIWDFARVHKCSEWSPKGAIFTGVELNADLESEADVTVSLSQRTVLLPLDDNGFLHQMCSIDTDLCPVNITGDIVALSNNISKALICNWKTDDIADTQHDHCLELYDSIFTCIPTHSFGWVDGASTTLTSILICSQSDNPWSLQLNSLELYSLSSFPPTLTSKVSSQRGALRCTDIILGKRVSVVWICPHDRAMVSHWEEHDSWEMLISAVFPGLLNPTTEVHVCEVCMNTLNNWTALDYDEDLGRIALGSAFGKVTIVQPQ
ncbi:uncharacterized protein ARMOST_20887 [Armillaria ostoyae]|uniref:F-box domain-containing protein n=1 Tax=Armillaria ostoyae TaxID=47428 RepID=A0A284S8J4_ARMOS|nr:uncharacterized protein ARMOST_20887 [Armillaria ostoyae]